MRRSEKYLHGLEGEAEEEGEGERAERTDTGWGGGVCEGLAGERGRERGAEGVASPANGKEKVIIPFKTAPPNPLS